MKTRITAILLLAALLFASCGGSKENKTEEGTTYYYTDEQSIKNVGKMEKLVSKETNEDFYLCSYGYKVYKV